MTTISYQSHEDLLNSLVDRYGREGYQVLRDPAPGVVPFDLGGYQPDLIAKKAGTNLIIEVKPHAERMSFDRLSSIAKEVRRHEGWRFILVTGQDVEDPALPGAAGESFSWDEVAFALKEAETLAARGANSLAFMTLWIVLEKMMRFQARSIAVPVDRLASAGILVRQLYSYGELSAEQLETALNLVSVRNQVVHGVAVPELSINVTKLAALVGELKSEWSKAPVDSEDSIA